MTPRTSKYIEDEDEPLYQTIRSLKSTQPQPQSISTVYRLDEEGGDAPTLPPRISEMSKEEK